RLERVPVVWQLLSTFAPLPVRLVLMPAVVYLSDVVMTTGLAIARAHPGATRLGHRWMPFYPPVDTSEFRPDQTRRALARQELGVPPEGLLVGTVGNFNWQKGHEFFVEAAAHAQQRSRNVFFRLLGASTPTQASYYEEKVKKLAARLGLLSKGVLQFVEPGNRVAALLPAFDIFMLTSRAEGVPTSILEAMACGLPVIATDVGAVREVVDEGSTGRVVPPRNSKALAAAILDLLQSPSTRSEMGAVARAKAVERYDTRVCAETHLAAYELARVGRQKHELALPFRTTLRQPQGVGPKSSTALKKSPRVPIAMKPQSFQVLGIRVNAVQIPQVIAQMEDWIRERQAPRYIAVTGMHGVVEAQHSASFKQVLNEADLVVADGMPLVWLGRWRGFRMPRRVYGPDLLEAFCATTGGRYRHFFYGGAPGVAALLGEKLNERHGIQIAGGYSPPFRPLTPEEVKDSAARIEAAAPDILWVGLSTPKQERWMAEFRAHLNVPVLVGVGAAFDFLSGRVNQAPRHLRDHGFEWLYRLVAEPRRLWRRYLVYGSEFVWKVMLELLGVRKLT
ncbi:MAG: WecB/TagA/CpsF family glycosyltransferase, partial [Acidobacteriia bacterium]|nr:WecB/TagA/CpsF family glycosyltransferase [Terriglobia bacterium]